MQKPATIITPLENDRQLTRALINNFGKLIVFVCYGEWNPESGKLLQDIGHLLEQFGDSPNTKYYNVAAEKCPEFFTKFGIDLVPTVLFTKTDKTKIDIISGQNITAAEVLEKAEKLEADLLEQFIKEKEKWFPKIESILRSCPVIVFMKGSASAPRCGFSESIIKILDDHQIEYAFYDIDKDEEMRHWLRYYIKWPTYPMLFIEGKLVGGLDVTRDLVAKGELEPLVPGYAKKLSGADRLKALGSIKKPVALVNGFSFENPAIKSFLETSSSQFGSDLMVVNAYQDSKLMQQIKAQGIELPVIIGSKH